MGLYSAKILGISITTDPKEKVLEEIQKYLKKGSLPGVYPSSKTQKPFVIVTPNPEQIVYAQGDTHFAKLLNQADVALPDGVGLLWASRFLRNQLSAGSNQQILKRVPGVDFMEDLVTLSSKEGYTIGLIGGRDGVAVKALECLHKKNPGLVGWGANAAEFEMRNSKFEMKNSDKSPEDYMNSLVEKIKGTKTRVLFIGLGAPKQEYVMEAVSNQLSAVSHPLVLMSVGGSFDEISGRIPRPPKWISDLGFKWLWRLILEPSRFRRQLALLRFIWIVVLEKLRR